MVSPVQRGNIRRSRAVAIMTQFRIDLSPREHLEALALVARLDLALIANFGEAVPDPNEHWDARKIDREIERRVARLRWVGREQEREFGGLRGLINRIRGVAG